METENLIFEDNRTNSHKFWSATLNGSVVTTTFGRIGTTGQIRTNNHATPEEAEKAYTKSVKEKLTKGYVRSNTAKAITTTDSEPVRTISVPDVRPMLAEEIHDSELLKYVKDDRFAMQQKLDGHRILLAVEDGQVVVLGRGGQVSQHAPLFAQHDYADVKRLPDCVIDGELVDRTLWLFDMPVYADGYITLKSPYRDRISGLGHLFAEWVPDENYRLLRSAYTQEAKAQLAKECLETGAEGVMIKLLSASYQPGQRVSTNLKLKFVKTADVVVTGVGVQGKDNYELSVWKDEEMVVVGRCSAIGKAKVEVGQVIEVKYLYMAEGDRLYQPRMIRVRVGEKAAEECLWSQFDHAHVNKKVLR